MMCKTVNDAELGYSLANLSDSVLNNPKFNSHIWLLTPFHLEYNSSAEFNSHAEPMWFDINSTVMQFGGGAGMVVQGIRDGM